MRQLHWGTTCSYQTPGGAGEEGTGLGARQAGVEETEARCSNVNRAGCHWSSDDSVPGGHGAREAAAQRPGSACWFLHSDGSELLFIATFQRLSPHSGGETCVIRPERVKGHAEAAMVEATHSAIAGLEEVTNRKAFPTPTANSRSTPTVPGAPGVQAVPQQLPGHHQKDRRTEGQRD